MSEETQKTPASLAPKLQKILDSVAELSVLELSQLVKALEEKFDVHPAVAGAAPIATGATPAADGQTPAGIEEKSEFEVTITDGGANKIAVIKVVREYKPEMGLKDAKDLIDAPPASLGTMKKEQAEEAKKKFEEAGAQVELK